MTWLGLDIGGANLKAADGCGWARSVPFALWREPELLADTLADLVAAAPPAGGLAIAMTGELCDCFRTKADGVRHILKAVRIVAAGRDVLVYLVDGRYVPLDEACARPQFAAASNWRALAKFACRYTERRPGLLIDVGSTTTDVVLLIDGEPHPRGLADVERLLAGELVYTGVARTPICALTPSMPWRGQLCPIAAELFATTADAYVSLGEISEQPAATWTADGRPLTAEFARARLARMLCSDTHLFAPEDAQRAAEFIRDAQISQLCVALDQVTSAMKTPPERAVVCGQGEFLARRTVSEALPDCRLVSLADYLGQNVSECAPAHALAILAAEKLGI